MIRTAKLVELEKFVGYNCQTKVISGPGPGILTVQMWVLIDDVIYAYQKSFTPQVLVADEDGCFQMLKDAARKHFDRIAESDTKNFERL